jgi:hypothetical protein
MKKPVLLRIAIMNTLLCSTIMQASGYSRKIENWTAKQECQYYSKHVNVSYGAQHFSNKKFNQAQEQARHENPAAPYQSRQQLRRTIPSRPSGQLTLIQQQPTLRNNNSMIGQ